MKELPHKCPHCGASMASYWHSLTPGILNALVKFYTAICDHKVNKIHLLKDMKGHSYELTDHEWNNFTKLRFHGLAVQDDESGYWLITRRGVKFLHGEIQIPDRVRTFRGEIIERSENYVTVNDVMGTQPYFEQDFARQTMPVITPVEYAISGQALAL